MKAQHSYTVTVEWLGNRGTGTSGYRAYGRQHTIGAAGKVSIEGSADRTFHGDKERWNPEEMLLASLSQCHMLSYLHVAVLHGVVVTGYSDEATGTLSTNSDGGGGFTSATLHPVVILADKTQAGLADALHLEAGEKCFIANSVSFPVRHEPIAR